MSLPLFGPRSFFGAKAEFCRHVVKVMNEAGESPVYDRDIDPVQLLSEVSVTDLLHQAGLRGVDLDTLVPVDLSDNRLFQYVEEVNDRNVQMVGSHGEQASDRLRVKIMLQMDALDDTCADPPPYTDEQAKIANEMRDRFRRRLAHLQFE